MYVYYLKTIILSLPCLVVLSSEEDEEEEEREEEEASALNIQPPDCAKFMNKVDESARVYEQKSTPECNSQTTEMYAQVCMII